MQAVAWVFIVGAAASWGAAATLIRAALQRPPIRFLTAVAVASLVGAIGASLLLPLAVNVLGTNEILQREQRVLFLLLALVLFEIPGPAFLFAYWRGYFRDGAS